MAETESSVIDKIEVLETGHIGLRRADKVFRDEKEISVKYHRSVLSPGDDLKGQDERVKARAKAVWTPKVITAYKAMVEAAKQT